MLPQPWSFLLSLLGTALYTLCTRHCDTATPHLQQISKAQQPASHASNTERIRIGTEETGWTILETSHVQKTEQQQQNQILFQANICHKKNSKLS